MVPGDICGLNWADTRDNFQADVLYLSGLGPEDTNASAALVADRVIGQMYALAGANTVRMPINEATVGRYWDTYTGAIDAALARGNVILCYWAAKDGKPADPPAFKEMWATVIDRYGARAGVYFEPINEPHGLEPAALNDFYNDWLTAFPNIPRDRVILDGSGYAQKPVTVGGDARLDGCLLGYHEYSFFDSQPNESAWGSHIRADIGKYHDRTVCTEFGAAMKSGLDYGRPSSDEFVRYVRAITGQFREWGMPSVYWPGVRDDDGYSLCTRSGSGADINLSINNASGLSLVQYGWGGEPDIEVVPTPARSNLLRRILTRFGLG